MLFVIDRGNSFVKLAIFRKDELIELRRIQKIRFDVIQRFLDQILHNYPGEKITNGIFSSVGKSDAELVQKISEIVPLVQMSSHLTLPIKNHYKTPDTLGHDRIAAATGAAGMHPGKNILTIDAGSCITFDFITSKKEYLGGSIAPGIKMRFDALHTFTARLPLVNLEGDVSLIGNTTESSIRSGVLKGTLAEIRGMISQYRESFPDLIVLLTGGDTNYFEKNLKNNIFAVPNLVLYGLRDILKHNVDL